jgi:hypothetical protein
MVILSLILSALGLFVIFALIWIDYRECKKVRKKIIDNIRQRKRTIRL